MSEQVVDIGGVKFDIKAKKRAAAKYHFEQARKSCERIDKAVEAAQKLAATGLWTPGPYFSPDYICIKVENPRETLKRYRDALGCALRLEGTEVNDARKRIITKYLRPANYPNVSLYYEDKLPRKARCKIVKEERKSYKLVCEC
jgi:hypothetical protein